jgi:putative transcriptional regulator
MLLGRLLGINITGDVMKRTAKEAEAMIIAGFREAAAIHRGEAKPVRERLRTTTARDAKVTPPPAFDAKRVVAVRTSLDVSQPVFAKVLNVSPKLVQAWEQGARKPNGASQRLLQVAEENGTYLVKKMAQLQQVHTSGTVRSGHEHGKLVRPAAAKRKRA